GGRLGCGAGELESSRYPRRRRAVGRADVNHLGQRLDQPAWGPGVEREPAADELRQRTVATVAKPSARVGRGVREDLVEPECRRPGRVPKGVVGPAGEHDEIAGAKLAVRLSVDL